MVGSGKHNQKKRKGRLDRVLYLVSLGMLAATIILDELDRRKKGLKNGG